MKDRLLEKDVARQRMSIDEAKIVKERINPTTTLDGLSEVDFVIEAAPVRSLTF